MEPRKRFQDQLSEKADVIIEGTVNGTVVRWATWPFEKSFYDAAQKNNSLTYRQIYRHNFTTPILSELNKSFFRTGFLQTVSKSATNIGVINYIDHFYRDYTANEKSLLAVVLCTPLETILTSRGEYHKVNDFFKMQSPHRAPSVRSTVFTLAFGRVMSATSIRVLWSSIVTFGGIYKATECIETVFLKQSADHQMMVKPTAAFLSSFMLQPLIMPVINYQTFILNDPGRDFVANSKRFVNEHTIGDLVKGSFGRSIHRSIYYGLTFFISEKIKQVRENEELKKHENSSCAPVKRK